MAVSFDQQMWADLTGSVTPRRLQSSTSLLMVDGDCRASYFPVCPLLFSGEGACYCPLAFILDLISRSETINRCHETLSMIQDITSFSSPSSEQLPPPAPQEEL